MPPFGPVELRTLTPSQNRRIDAARGVCLRRRGRTAHYPSPPPDALKSQICGLFVIRCHSVSNFTRTHAHAKMIILSINSRDNAQARTHGHTRGGGDPSPMQFAQVAPLQSARWIWYNVGVFRQRKSEAKAEARKHAGSTNTICPPIEGLRTRAHF